MTQTWALLDIQGEVAGVVSLDVSRVGSADAAAEIRAMFLRLGFSCRHAGDHYTVAPVAGPCAVGDVAGIVATP